MSEYKRYLSQSDFGKLCGYTKNPGPQIGTRIKRGELVYDKTSKTLDVENAKNKAFLRSKMNYNGSPTRHEEPKVSKSNRDNDGNGELKIVFKADGSIDVSKLQVHSLSDIKIVEDIRLKQANVRLKELEELKLRGKFIDSDLAAESLLVFAQTFMRMTVDKFNSWAIDIGHRNKLSKSELAKINGEIKNNINSAYEESLSEAESKMEQAKKETIKNLENTEDDESEYE